MAAPKDNRNRAVAMRCAKLAREGYTHRGIAELVGKRPEQIRALIALGERLEQLQVDK